jgi:aspartyl protease family protein
MNGDGAVDLIWAIGALVIVGSALAARRLPLAKAWKLTLVWIAIFGAAFLIASYLT